MRSFLKGFFGVVITGMVAASLLTFTSRGAEKSSGVKRMMGTLLQAGDLLQPEAQEKSPEELYHEALRRSSDVKGLYMTADVANDQGAGATRLRNHIIGLAKTTEINGIVIDVKEVCGPDYVPTYLKVLLDTLHQNHIWAIARIVVFKDAAQIYAHSEWYLKRASPKTIADQCANRKYLRSPSSVLQPPSSILWQDNKGGYWLDPASPGAREYIASFAKRMIDLGFDELQFDYMRFPSDGDVNVAIYPAWNHKTQKYAVMKSFFSLLGEQLRAYKPDIILSADLFGYAALQYGDVGIGQRLQDIGESFDYISFMVYPSHYYGGLYMPVDPIRKLPPVALDNKRVRARPDITVGRSLQAARDFLDGIGTSTRAAASSTAIARSQVRLRPWLEDFFHEQDRLGHRPYGVEKVKMQIAAAERVEQHGWLLWNASNVYSEGALRKEN
ncbi:MAG: hypothetical protein HY007_01330 [Candidatus Sungbacteria bacterium]|nr:hypothetical protein [Candidatus Sungbacteria bacterium]